MDGDRITSTPSDGCSNDIQNMRPLNGRTSGPTRRSTKGQWTAEEDEILRKAVQRFKGKNWKKIAECFKDRTDVQCLHRWQKVLNPELIKGPWSKEEDEIIIELVHKHGPKKWSTIARHLPGRIGKQCRERWHNHLNPAINKEAWTQQEELALIRAHQIYGNRWAELSKFLPGRSDNAIKNHWNSSVKKKLESYLASGLLDQFPALPLAANHHQSTPASSSRMQSSGEDSGHRSSREAEEISECSQDANVIGYSQSAGNLANAVIHTKDEFQLTEESGLREEHSSSPASFQIQDITFEAGCSSSFLGPNLSHNAGNSASTGYQFNSHELPNISSMELGQESSGLPTQYPGANASHKMVNVAFQTSLGFRAPASVENLAVTPSKRGRVLISDDECCRVLFSGAMNDGCFSSSACSDSLLCQHSNFQSSERGRTSASNSYYPSRSSVLQSSSCQPSLSVPSMLTVDEDALVYACADDQLIGHPFAIQEEDYVSGESDGFIYTNDSTNSLSGSGAGNSGLQEQIFEIREPSKLVPVNSFGSGSDIVLTCPPIDEKPSMITEQQDGGALCYEPPRFPSVDVPFFSCDLIQSGSDMQQEYSPLGIRQLMMSSMNCVTPFRLWDSPSRDGSPEAVLKSAAKTFTGTPSILKKRNRDLLSPLSDRRADKKLEIDVTSSLSKEFSRLDVLFDDSETDKESPMSLSSNHKRNSVASIDDQENLDPALEAGRENHRNHSPTSNITFSNKDFKSDNFEEKMEQRDVKTNVDPDTSPQSVQRQCGVLVERNGLDNSDDRISDEHFESGNSERNIKQGITDTTDGKINLDPEAGAQTVEQHRGVLHEHKKNDLSIVSPDQVAYKVEKGSGSSAQIPRNQYNKRLGAASGRVYRSESSSGNPCLVVCSPSGCGKNLDIHPIAVTSAHPVPPSLPLETMVNNAGNENSGIFGETPFKRSSDSPSAWKSPWFINSFLPGPRIDTDITIEDIGYLMSPSERSYDAIGLMKQLSEHTAAAYAEALEVLGNDTPETILRRKCANIQNLNQENHMAHNDTENRPHLASNVLSECRVLDFSECGTPGKEAENKKSSTAVNFSSPSSYLMKGCR